MSQCGADIRIGTARWNIPFGDAARSDPSRKREGSLARYSRHLNASEVNSCFYRHHRASTWARWAAATPAGFRFSMKLPRSITHDARLELVSSMPVIQRFVEEVSHVGPKRGPLLVQLPPSLAFDADAVEPFLAALLARWRGEVALEPRHPSWFVPDADALLAAHRVARVAADPVLAPAADHPGGWSGLAYLRLHGSPRTYWSSYDEPYLEQLAQRIRQLAEGNADSVWCIFDNTAAGAGLPNALRLLELLGAGPPLPERAAGGPRFRVLSDSRQER